MVGSFAPAREHRLDSHRHRSSEDDLRRHAERPAAAPGKRTRVEQWLGQLPSLERMAPPTATARAPAAPAVRAPAPLRFKDVADPAVYLPRGMPDLSERETQQLVTLVERRIEQDRRAAQRSLDKLHTAWRNEARAIRALRPKLEHQIRVAQHHALARVSSVEARQAAVAAAAFTAAQAQVHGAAGVARGKLDRLHAGTIATLHEVEVTATEKLANGATTARTTIAVAERREAARVTADYRAAHPQVDTACATQASRARGLGDAVPLPYSGVKLAAARAAARVTAASWATEVPAAMQRDAEAEIFDHEPASVAAVHDQATTHGHRVEVQRTHRASALRAAHRRARIAVDAARSEALSRIDAIASSTSGSLSSQSAAEVAAIHHQAAAARAEIIETGRHARKRVARVCNRALLALETMSPGLVQRAGQIEVPDHQHTRRAVNAELARRETTVRSTLSELAHEAHRFELHLASEGADAASALTVAARSAAAAAAQTAQPACQAIAGVPAGAARSMRDPGEHFAMVATAIVERGNARFDSIAGDLQIAYGRAEALLPATLRREVTTLDERYAGRIDREEPPAILEAAARAAATVTSAGTWSFLRKFGSSALDAVLTSVVAGRGLLAGFLGVVLGGASALAGGIASLPEFVATMTAELGAAVAGFAANGLYKGVHRLGAIAGAEASRLDKLRHTLYDWVKTFRGAAEARRHSSLALRIRDYASRFVMATTVGAAAELLLNPTRFPYDWPTLLGAAIWSLPPVARGINAVAKRIGTGIRRGASRIRHRVGLHLPGSGRRGRHRKTLP